MRTHIFLTHILALMLAFGGARAEAERFSVDHMLALEGIGEVRFSPDGSTLFFEQLRPYEKQSSFASQYMFEKNNADIMIAKAGGEAEPRPLLSKNGAPSWLGAFSPDGARVVVHWLEDERIRTGVYTLKSGKLVEAPGNIRAVNESFGRSPRWVSNTAIVFNSVPDREQRRHMSRTILNSDERRRLEEKSWSGRAPTATHLKTGVANDDGDVSIGELIYFDVRRKRARTLARGDFRGIFASPRSGKFVAVEYLGNRPSRDLQDMEYEYGKYDLNALRLFDISNLAQVRTICASTCSVTSGVSLRWSESGEKLAFVAYNDAPDFQKPELFIYNGEDDTAAPVTVPDVVGSPSVISHTSGRLIPNAVWLGERLVMRARVREGWEGEPSTQRLVQAGAFDWFAVSDDGRAVRNLTAALASPPADYLAVWDKRLLLVHDGDLVAVSYDGETANLTSELEQDVREWCSWYYPWRDLISLSSCNGFGQNSFSRGADRNFLEKGKIIVRLTAPAPQEDGETAIAEDEKTEFGVFDLAARTVAPIQLPSSGDRLFAVSPRDLSPVFHRTGADGDRLARIRADGDMQVIAHINRHLSGVEGGTVRRLSFKRDDGSTGHDWVLLPPGHKDGERHPLIVRFYPGSQGTAEQWSGYGGMRKTIFINEYILASAGYAVLVPSMPPHPDGVPGDTMLEMHEPLERAAARVVAAGYADPEAWFLMGHSYGGYGALSAVTQTNAFDGAIAMSAPINLMTHYGNFDTASTALMRSASLTPGVHWAETGQGRMGVAPWRDPDRYVRNSPVLHIDSIETPVLLIHGDLDFVDVSNSEQMFNALNRVGKDAEFVRYWGEAHTFASPANIRHMYETIFRWLDRLHGPR